MEAGSAGFGRFAEFGGQRATEMEVLVVEVEAVASEQQRGRGEDGVRRLKQHCYIPSIWSDEP